MSIKITGGPAIDCLEGGGFYGGIESSIVLQLSPLNEFVPFVRLLVTKASQISFEASIHSFCLSIRLRMKSCDSFQDLTHGGKQFLPKMAKKNLISIGDRLWMACFPTTLSIKTTTTCLAEKGCFKVIK